MNDRGYVAIVEWDGVKPPMAYYKRLHYLTGRVRGNGNDPLLSPIARRGGEKFPSVTMQEGAIFCADETLARTVANLAKKYGAASTYVGSVTNMEPVVATEEDKEVLRRIEQVAGRVGRPPSGRAHGDYAVECYNEMRTFRIDNLEQAPLFCPRCGSFLMNALLYRAHPMHIADGGEAEYIVRKDRPILCEWVRARVYMSDYDPRLTPLSIKIDPHTKLPMQKTSTMYYSDDGTYKDTSLMENVKNLPSTMGGNIIQMMLASDLSFIDAFNEDPLKGFEILDAIFVARWKHDRARLSRERMTFIAEALERNDDLEITKILPSDKVDFFDAASRIENSRMHRLFDLIRIYDQQNNIQRDFYAIA